ncbi:MAG: hypothetical protein IT536_19830 [Hyphomicrobiales bacterium]|nr:hypothetical protein [Hyphomicrobiales bacterium]
MDYVRTTLAALLLLAALVPQGAAAQQATDKPIDFKPLLPPIMPVPPNTAVTSGSVGGRQDPYTTAPLQNPVQAPTQTAPGLRLTIPAR